MLHNENVYVCHLERECVLHREMMKVYMCVSFREREKRERERESIVLAASQ